MGYTLIDESGQPAKGRYTLLPDAPAAPDSTAADGGSTLQVWNPFGKNIDTGIPVGESLNRALAGAGKAFVDTGRGVGQALGIVSDKDIAEARKLDAPLMKTTAGTVGNIVGNVAQTLPTLLIPGAATLRGAAAIGAAQGFLQPVTSRRETIDNTLIGAGAGAGGVAAARVVKGVAQGAKALAEPFSESGRQQIAGRMLQRFADNPQAIDTAVAGPTVTGAMPTLAEATGDRGLAQLQDALRSVDPQIGNQIASRLGENNAARAKSLQSLAGTSAERDAAELARTAASSHLYRQATSATYTVDSQLTDLLKRPAVQQAMTRAETLAANQGRPFSFATNPNSPFSGLGVSTPSTTQVTGQGLQDLKMAMDEMLSDPASGFTGAAGNTIKSLRGKLVDWMEQANPDFKAARQSYAAASKPLNGMDVGEYLATKGTANLSDLAGNPRLMANSLLGTLRDEPKLLRAATGRRELSSLAQVFEPPQLGLLDSIAGEADRAAAVAAAGNGPGSATAQRMASQNILRQLVGPTGLPQSWAESALANTALGKPLNLVYGGVAEPKIQQLLAQAVLDPQAARQALAAARQGGLRIPDNLLTRIMAQAARATPATATVTGQ